MPPCGKGSEVPTLPFTSLWPPKFLQNRAFSVKPFRQNKKKNKIINLKKLNFDFVKMENTYYEVYPYVAVIFRRLVNQIFVDFQGKELNFCVCQMNYLLVKYLKFYTSRYRISQIGCKDDQVLESCINKGQ